MKPTRTLYAVEIDQRPESYGYLVVVRHEVTDTDIDSEGWLTTTNPMHPPWGLFESEQECREQAKVLAEDTGLTYRGEDAGQT